MKNYDKKFLKINREPLMEDFFVSKKGKTEQLMSKKHKEVTTFTQQMLAEADRRQQMIGKVVMCTYCGEVFVAKGTRKYCYGDECRNAEKRYRQSIVDGLAAQIKKGLYANYKILNELQPESGESRFDYDKVLKKGFDQHAFYGTYINSIGEIWHIVGEYYFTFSHKDEMRFLHIYKK